MALKSSKILLARFRRSSNLNLLRLSKHVFSSKDHLHALNQIIWPEIYVLIKSAADKEVGNNTDLFVVDAALLLESGYKKYFDQ